MTGMLVPMVHSYFAIYTLEAPVEPKSQGRAFRGLSWDLHATATDKSMAISHARMLALQPGVDEVHVKQVTENHANGTVSVRDVTRCKRRDYDALLREWLLPAAAVTVLAAAFLAVLS